MALVHGMVFGGGGGGGDVGLLALLAEIFQNRQAWQENQAYWVWSWTIKIQALAINKLLRLLAALFVIMQLCLCILYKICLVEICLFKK